MPTLLRSRFRRTRQQSAGVSINRNDSIATGIAGAWEFDHPLMWDLAGNYSNLTTTSRSVRRETTEGWGLERNLSGSMTSANNYAKTTTPITVEAWIYPLSVADNIAARILYIGNYNGGTPNAAALELFHSASPLGGTTGGMLYARFNNGHTYTAAGVLVANRWQHVVMTYDGGLMGSGSINFYVDNGAALSKTDAGITNANAMSLMSNPVNVGDYSTGRQVLSSVRFWERVLSAPERTALFQGRRRLLSRARRRFILGASGAAALAGDAVAQAQAAAALTTQIQLAGAAVVVAGASSSLSTAIPLAGAAVSIASGSGGLTAQITLAGAAVAQALAAAGLTTAIPLAGGAAGQASATGALTTGASGLAGDAVARAAATGALTAQITLTGSAAAIATATGSLNGTPAALAGAATAQASATGAITASIRLTADALAQAAATGSLTVSVRLSGAAAAQALASGNLSIGAVADLDTRFVVSRQTRNWVASRAARNWTVPA